LVARYWFLGQGEFDCPAPFYSVYLDPFKPR
jgi:hypothetical protein